ncbi:ABC transporter substrate-binding protein [Sinorhizobium sp. 7-81]|uniref:ABC transporter substrate-binding protein n=1 Tax=Sinorhizobium sp. 8-89 TaxID=3049089 RepID=UPI0024C3DC72|nr:ABC transporter substrate-binding protein [Sinorhizobium sp. 8-89]MDK1494590.1 ABC transporter substrate-binding protein [Sinorhizobium sp. 8-89]
MRLITTLACASLLGASSAMAADVTLQVSYAGPILEIMHKEIVQRFEAEHPGIKIALAPPVREYDELLQQTLRKAITGGMPDVAFFPLNRVSVLADRGLLQPMDANIASDPAWKDLGYSEGILPLGKSGNHQWSIPFQLSTPVIFYNKQLTSAAGFDTFPDSWSGIERLIDTIHQSGKIGGHIDYDLPNNGAFQALVMGAGGDLMDPAKKEITFDGPEGVAAIDLLRRFVGAGMVDMSRDQARQAFAAGTIGLHVSSSSILGKLAQQIGDKFELGVAPLPVSAKIGRVPLGGSSAVILTKDPVKEKAAWEYIKFVVGPEGQTISTKATGYIPLNDTAVNRADLLGDFLKANPNYSVAMAAKAHSAPVFEFPGENSVRISDEIRNCLQAAINGKTSSTDTLACMRSAVQRLVPQQ